ncbi:MAG: M17 family peptidase N-terminal domain-containing protein, partial [Acidimicrobiales bacterium]
MSPVRFAAATRAPDGAQVLAVPVVKGAAPPGPVLGFEGEKGQTRLAVDGGRAVLAVGLGDPAELDAGAFRTAGASIVRGAGKAARVATTLLD